MGEFSSIYRTELSDGQLMRFWALMRACGRDTATFYNVPPMEERDFAFWARSADVHPWIILFRGEPCGLFWLTDQEGTTAKCHFATLPQGTKRTEGKLPVAQGFGLYSLGMALHARDEEGRYLLDRCYGITPLYNRAAISFIHRVGAMDIAVLPGAVFNHATGHNADALLTMYTRDTVPAENATL